MKKVRVELTEQQMNDLLSAVSFTLRKHPKDSPNFLKALERVNKKLWKSYREDL